MILTQTIKKLVVLSTLPLVACSTITTRTPEGNTVEMGEAEFSAYLEHVFRHHNKVVDYLMFTTGRSENEVSDAGTHLVEMEAKMSHACLPLNELITESMLGHTPNFWTRMKLADAVPACEAATRKVERLLPGDYGRTEKNGAD